MRRPDRLLARALLLTALALGSAAGAGELALVDTHLHYSRDAWAEYAPETIVALLDRAGIRRAFVSSTPDEGTLRLFHAAPSRIVPVLRPYRERDDLGRWYQDPGVPAYLEDRLNRARIYRGIGEFHLSGEQARAPVVRQVADLARRERLFLHCHCDAEAAEILSELAPDVRLLWAHAGMSSPPDAVARLLARHPNLSVELALRSDVAAAGGLDPAWRAAFLAYPDRFMVGTDTWIPSRWAALVEVQATTRAWLGELPPAVAVRIASENAERLAAGR